MRKLTVRELGRPSQQAFQKQEKHRVILVLDNIRSGLNVGSIFRTADAFAIERVILCGITPQPPHREILKTALGATESVSWQYFENTADAVRELQEGGYEVWPVEQTDQSKPLQSLSRSAGHPMAFVLGNEVDGVSDDVIAMLSQSIEIPQHGTKHSLNVAVAAGIVLWHTLYQKA